MVVLSISGLIYLNTRQNQYAKKASAPFVSPNGAELESALNTINPRTKVGKRDGKFGDRLTRNIEQFADKFEQGKH